ncbi:hypothetical protein P3S67_022125 [Capsicum chacoense]
MVEKEKIVVYLYGGNKGYAMWYRLVLPFYRLLSMDTEEAGLLSMTKSTGLEELSVATFVKSYLSSLAMTATLNSTWPMIIGKNLVKLTTLTKRLCHLPSSDIERFETHFQPTTVVEDDVNQVFYSFEKGSMLIVDTSAGSMMVEHGHPSQDNFSFVTLRNRRGPVPLGLERCHSADRSLDTAVACTRPVLLNQTLYYFTYDLRLYGYDLDLRKWFRSESLHPQIYPLEPNHDSYLSVHTLLLPLPNLDLLALTQEQREAGCFTMASLSVNKNDTSLDVTVKHTQQFRTDYPLFIPIVGKAIRLKNTGSGGPQGMN